MEFYKHDQLFLLLQDVINSARKTGKKVLLSVILNLMLIEINLYQIRISDSRPKRENVCAVYPYLLFVF